MKRLFLLIFLLVTCFGSGNWVQASAGELAVVINKANPIDSLSLRDLTKIFKFDKQFWDHGQKIYLVLQEADSSQIQILISKVYQMKDYHELKTYWLGLIFREELTAFPQTLSSDEAIKRFISQAPNAIGVIDASVVDDRVKVVRVDGHLPGEQGYQLTNNP